VARSAVTDRYPLRTAHTATVALIHAMCSLELVGSWGNTEIFFIVASAAPRLILRSVVNKGDLLFLDNDVHFLDSHLCDCALG
jgi:hypothetical protein